MLLALLLENVGLDAVVQVGDPERWREALAARTSGLNRATDTDWSNVLAELAMASSTSSTEVNVVASSSESTWNYRVIEFVSGEDAWCAIHKVYYEGGEPRRFTDEAAAALWDCSEGIVAGLRVLERMKDALLKPPLKEADFGLPG